jgi:hypothetical protein
MKKHFYFGLTLLLIFELLNVYFIMPFPGSQNIESIDFAFVLYSYRWFFRILLSGYALLGVIDVFKSKYKLIPVFVSLIALIAIYIINFKMSADHIFLQPSQLKFENIKNNNLDRSALIIGVTINEEAKAYPIRYLSYHHQIQDLVGGENIIVTYCNVCRSGRVYSPIVNNHLEKFRLVGMDHYNAMFEDETTRSWWRQANGEAIAGKLKGEKLTEINSIQVTVDKWFQLYPNGLIMQADKASKLSYDTLGKFEKGLSTGSLTNTDSISWSSKSWVIGVKVENQSKAYDWNELKVKRIINDKVGNTPIVLIISEDNNSFVAYERPNNQQFTLKNDTLYSKNFTYNFSGKNIPKGEMQLKKLNSYQEFWHSWKYFNKE